ncbi:unnamed protein product, partial [Ectocarpus sp. 6 AP-2014]
GWFNTLWPTRFAWKGTRTFGKETVEISRSFFLLNAYTPFGGGFDVRCGAEEADVSLFASQLVLWLRRVWASLLLFGGFVGVRHVFCIAIVSRLRIDSWVGMCSWRAPLFVVLVHLEGVSAGHTSRRACTISEDHVRGVR